MELWKVERLWLWNIGILEYWNNGKLERWNNRNSRGEGLFALGGIMEL